MKTCHFVKAVFNSVLNINGTSSISSNWNIKITSITSKTLNGSATNAKDPEGVGTLTASFETNLESPGDSIEYTITISNQGNINAKLDKITLSDPDNEYVTFETSGLTEGEELNKGSTADLKVIVTFKDVDITKMDQSTSNLTVTLDFSQANVDENGIAVPGLPPIDLKGVEVPVLEEGTLEDGLYADEYEPGRYVYKGANSNNYITFNNETWRIISVETDGTLKIMKKDYIGYKIWDTSNSNNWARPATLNTYLNNETDGADSYYNILSSEAKSLIQEHTWGIGPVTQINTDLAAQIQSENGTTWTGKIGLMSLSDYLRANTNTTQCGNFSLNNTNFRTCKTTNYIFSSVPTLCLWTISLKADDSTHVYIVCSDGQVLDRGANDYQSSVNSRGVLPVVYLTSNITLSGEGTETNPYTINS